MTLVGMRKGKLTVIRDSGMRFRQQVNWQVKCDCGSNIVMTTKELQEGDLESCGCCAVPETSIIDWRSSDE